ncbi:MAG TPA: hypothetical protein VFV49_03440, partial [Thermoanaerobaculia bacterium]|nr:hypothetical protein [Thermoanaerobaculia bacterium]
AVLAIAIVEFVLVVRWNAFYFTAGIPIFWRRVDRPSGLRDVDFDELQKRCATAAGAPIVFHRLGPDAIAFREAVAGGLIHYFPIMRGIIRHRPEESSVVVSGLVKWWVVALLGLFTWYLRANVMDVFIYLVPALGILYLIQAVRFARIAKALRVNQ